MSRCRRSRPICDASPAFSIWIVNGYQLAITISLLPLASLGEIVGYRRVYLVGLVLFTLASAFCALAHTLPLLTIARIMQGFGAAGIMSVNSALVRFTYPRSQLGRGIGINALVVAFSAAVGPTLAAGILAVGSWPWLFAINVPLGVVDAGARLAQPAAHHACEPFLRLAERGAVARSPSASASPRSTASVMARRRSPASSQFAIAVVAGALLIYRETHMASPLLPVDLLRIPVFALSIATSIASFCGQMLAFVAIPFYLAEPLRLFGGADGPLDHAMADRGGVRSAARRPAGRALSGRPARRHRADAVRLRPRRARLAAGDARRRST